MTRMNPIRTHTYFIEQNGRIQPENIPDPRSNRAGIRAYGKFFGKILEIFKFAVKLESINKKGKVTQSWYVNINSLNQWRSREENAHPNAKKDRESFDTFIFKLKADINKDNPQKLSPKRKESGRENKQANTSIKPTLKTSIDINAERKLVTSPDLPNVSNEVKEEPLIDNFAKDFAPEKTKAEQFLKDQWAHYKLAINGEGVQSLGMKLGTLHLYNMRERGNEFMSNQLPDARMTQPLTQFENDPDVFVIPDPYFVKTRDPSPLLDNEENIQQLVKTANAAFLTGRKLVVGRFVSNTHAYVLTVTNTGKVTVIDSMRNQSVDLTPIVRAFNQFPFKLVNGIQPHFEGKIINTHLQKGGSDCTRFATLYAYQIAKEKDVEAYQTVNGAFMEGKLKTFEDYTKITGSKRVADATAVSEEKTKPFCQSWVYRNIGFKQDNWEDMTIQELQLEMNDHEEYIFNCNSSLHYDQRNMLEQRYLIKKKDGTFELPDQRAQPEISTATKLKSIRDTKDEHRIVSCSKNKVYSFSLNPGEKLARETIDPATGRVVTLRMLAV